MASARRDRRGHWPKGKPRNDPGIDRRALRSLMTRLRRVVRDRHEPGVVSYAALARRLGVCPKSVRRWARHERVPAATRVRRIERWLDRYGA